MLMTAHHYRHPVLLPRQSFEANVAEPEFQASEAGHLSNKASARSELEQGATRPFSRAAVQSPTACEAANESQGSNRAALGLAVWVALASTGKGNKQAVDSERWPNDVRRSC